MSRKKIKSIGLIVEDLSDFESFKALISRISGKNRTTYKKSIGEGCGKIRRKGVAYCQNLTQKGCDLVIIIHDLDKHNLVDLRSELESIASASPATFNHVCIPREELEAWFLSDPEGIKNALKLERSPSINGMPEDIESPKEKLGEQIYRCSGKAKYYLNTKHNKIISQVVSIERMNQRCSSFKSFHDYIKGLSFK